MGKYKIVAGTTEKKENAQHQYHLINRNQIRPEIKILQSGDKELYCVEAGPYSERKQLLKNLDTIKGLGIPDAFITDA